MKHIDWDERKNEQLRKEREISFEEIVVAISEGKVLDVIEHPNQKRYPNQRIFVINLNNYVYLVPFTENGEKVFLKTIIPSRKATKKYIIERRK